MVSEWDIVYFWYKSSWLITPFLRATGLQPIPVCPVYCSTKFGVVGFTRGIAPASTAWFTGSECKLVPWIEYFPLLLTHAYNGLVKHKSDRTLSKNWPWTFRTQNGFALGEFDVRRGLPRKWTENKTFISGRKLKRFHNSFRITRHLLTKV